MYKKFWITIPVHNRKSETENILEKLHHQSYKNFTIVICDDGSTDGTAEMIREKFPRVALLEGDGTLYWSGGYNYCLRYVFENATEEDYLLSLNDDTEFDEDYLSQLLKAATDNPDTLIMSVPYEKEGRDKMITPGYNIDPITMRQRLIKKEYSHNRYTRINSVCGRGLLIPIKIAKKIGFADEKHFLQMGDHDLCFRYQKNKIKAVIAYNARIYSSPSYTRERYFKNYSFINFFNYLTDIKSTGNLKYRFWAIVKNRPLFLIPINLFFDINCVIFGYFKRWVLNIVRKR